MRAFNTKSCTNFSRGQTLKRQQTLKPKSNHKPGTIKNNRITSAGVVGAERRCTRSAGDGRSSVLLASSVAGVAGAESAARYLEMMTDRWFHWRREVLGLLPEGVVWFLQDLADEDTVSGLSFHDAANIGGRAFTSTSSPK